MSLKKALDSHTAWNGRLKLALKNQGDIIDVGMVASDHRCELGKWIHGPAHRKFSKHKEYEHAKLAHQGFHLTASEVLIEHQSGNHDRAEELLKGKFRTASNKIQLELVRLFTTENSENKAFRS
ncbi:MAG: CZB domain-containing protein [bacterium]